MKYYILIISLGVLFFGVPFFYFGVVNTGVSIIYETEDRGCISLVTGADLCWQLFLLKAAMIFCAAQFILYLLVQHKIFPDKKEQEKTRECVYGRNL